MGPRIQEIVLDCADPARLAAFWGALLDAPWALVWEDWATVRAEGMYLGFQRVPEPKSGPKNRVHLDLEVDSLDEAVAAARALGARVVRETQVDDDGGGFVVLQDVEANEFCFVTDPAGTWWGRIEQALERTGRRA